MMVQNQSDKSTEIKNAPVLKRQKFAIFAIMLITSIIGIGLSLLTVKLFGLAFFTVFAVSAGVLLIALILSYIFLDISGMKNLDKSLAKLFKMAIFFSIFYISFVIFTNLIESGVMNIDFIRSWF